MSYPKSADSNLLLATLIVLLAAALRIFQLAEIPPGLFYDESANGVDALRVLAGTHPTFFVGDQGREPLQIYLQAASLAMLGSSPLALRLPSVVLGILTVAATYPTFRAFAGARVGLIGAGLVGASFWHVSLSRQALRTDGLPLFLTLAAYWICKGVQTGRARYFSIGGILVGIDLYTYIPSRLSPILFGFWLFGCLFIGSWRGTTSRRQIGIGALTGFIALAIVAYPLSRYFVSHPGDFVGRIGSLSASPIRALSGATFINGYWQAIVALVWSGDPDPLHGLPGRPLVDLPLGIFLVIGILLALRRWRAGAMIFSLVWCLVMLAPSALSVEPAHGLRLVGELPFILFFPALALDWLATKISLGGYQVGMALVGIVVLGVGVATARDYFGVWATRPATLQAFQADLLNSLSLVDQIPQGPAAFATARVYDGVPIPLALVPTARSRARSFEGLNTFVQPADGAGLTYYVVASSMVPPGGLPTAANLTLLGTTHDRIGQVDGRLYVARPPSGISPGRVLSVRIGDAVDVTGVDIPPRVQPGGIASVALHWTVRGQLPPGNWELFAHLVDRQDQRLIAQDYNDGFPQGEWRQGDQVISWFSLPVGVDSSAKLTDVNFGVFDVETTERLPATTPSGASAGNTIAAGPIRIDRPRPESAPEHALLVHFGEKISLLGYDIVNRTDGSLLLRLHWRDDRPISQDYTVFAHVLGTKGQFASGADGQPGQGLFPTSTWVPGETFIDDHSLQIAGGLPAGQIEFGVYLLATGERLPATADDGRSLGDAVRVDR